MKSVTVLKGQSLFDIALQACGNANYAYDIALINNISVTSFPEAGSRLQVPEVKSKSAAGLFSNNKVISKSVSTNGSIFFYQGEDIPVNIIGNMELKNSNFIMLVYHHCNPNNILKFYKTDFEEKHDAEDGTVGYRCNITNNKTRELYTGSYVIEIMVQEEDGYRSVYQNLNAFTIKFSNAKNIEL